MTFVSTHTPLRVLQHSAPRSRLPLPKDILARTADEVTRRIALSFLDEAHAASARLDDPDDAEALHDFRVAIRRLRSAVRAHRHHLDSAVDKKGRRALRRLQRGTGAARDAEVQLEWMEELGGDFTLAEQVGVDWFRDRVERTRAAAEAGVVDEAKRRFELLDERLRTPIATLTTRLDLPDDGVRFGPVVGGLMRAHVAELAALLEVVVDEHDETPCHDARIACKRLRYLLEPLRRALSPAKTTVNGLKRLQDVLGDLHDMHVLRDTLAKRRSKLLVDAPEAAGLEALGVRVAGKASALFQRLASEWLGAATDAFVRQVDELARTCEGAGQIETERKLLLSRFPEAARRGVRTELAQGYLPGDELHERLRRVDRVGGVQYLRTVKVGAGVTRVELEEETSAEIFSTLWPLTEGCRVEKERYAVQDGAFTWVIDRFTDRELVLAEVELPSGAIRPPLPKWLAPHVVGDVTDDSRYVNLNLAR